MKNLQNSEKNAFDHTKLSESDKKRDVNLKSNSSLYFQIGLILCLLATYGLFEMNFKKTIIDYEFKAPIDEPAISFIRDPHVIPDEPVKKRQPERRIAILTDKAPIIADDNAIINTPDIVINEPVVSESPTTNTTFQSAAPTIEKPKEWDMNNVEKVPIFPGCESAKNNAERMACMSEKLTKLIQKKFNTDLAHELGLSGIQRIQVQFKIDDRGQVTDIKTRSPYSQLEKEAERVVNKIPVMTPGMQRNTPVSVVYYLPIAFQVH